MSTVTARGGLVKPTDAESADIAVLNANSDKLSLYAMGAFICTSTTRPAAPWQGQMIYETDTFNLLNWGGSNWRKISGPNQLVVNVNLNTDGVVGPSAGIYIQIASVGSFTPTASGTLDVSVQAHWYAAANAAGFFELRYGPFGSVSTAPGLNYRISNQGFPGDRNLHMRLQMEVVAGVAYNIQLWGTVDSGGASINFGRNQGYFRGWM